MNKRKIILRKKINKVIIDYQKENQNIVPKKQTRRPKIINIGKQNSKASTKE